MAQIRTMKVKRPFVKQRNMFGARMKIVWEEQLVDPQNDFIIVLCHYIQHDKDVLTI